MFLGEVEYNIYKKVIGYVGNLKFEYIGYVGNYQKEDYYKKKKKRINIFGRSSRLVYKMVNIYFIFYLKEKR